MDNQNTYFMSFFYPAQNFVLILVLMDNQNTILIPKFYNYEECLNPCSNG